MKQFIKNSALVFTSSILLISSAFAADIESVKAWRVQGSVEIQSNADASFTPLVNGTIFQKGATVKTGPESSAQLFLSNGSSISMSPDSSITLVAFSQEPFEGKRVFDRLRKEPSVSQIKIKVNYGNVITKAKKLQVASAFEVESEVGIARLTGSTYSQIHYDNVSRTMTIASLRGMVEAKSDNDAWTPIEAGKFRTYPAKKEGLDLAVSK